MPFNARDVVLHQTNGEEKSICQVAFYAGHRCLTDTCPVVVCVGEIGGGTVVAKCHMFERQAAALSKILEHVHSNCNAILQAVAIPRVICTGRVSAQSLHCNGMTMSDELQVEHGPLRSVMLSTVALSHVRGWTVTKVLDHIEQREFDYSTGRLNRMGVIDWEHATFRPSSTAPIEHGAEFLPSVYAGENRVDWTIFTYDQLVRAQLQDDPRRSPRTHAWHRMLCNMVLRTRRMQPLFLDEFIEAVLNMDAGACLAQPYRHEDSPDMASDMKIHELIDSMDEQSPVVISSAAELCDGVEQLHSSTKRHKRDSQHHQLRSFCVDFFRHFAAFATALDNCKVWHFDAKTDNIIVHFG